MIGPYYPQRKKQAENQIKRWESIYSEEEVRLFVKEFLQVTRSPGKRDAYEAWLDAHEPKEV